MEHIINTEINTELIRRLALCERVWSKLKLQQNGGASPAGITLLIVYPSEVDHAALVADRQGRGKLMEWARTLARITGTVDQQLLLRKLGTLLTAMKDH